MAGGTEDVPQPGVNGVTYSQRLWSEEVAAASAMNGEPLSPNEPGYEFSNGRRFDTGPGATANNG